MQLYIAMPTNVSKEHYKKNFGNINNSLWNIAVANAPYKTGNLRLNIKKSSSSLDKVTFVYDDLEAAYVNFLEEGIGRNKRHVGFIEFKTINNMLFEIFSFFYNGKVSYGGMPSVAPRTDRVRNYERKMMKSLGLSVDSRINASERATLSSVFSSGQKGKKTKQENYMNMQSPINTGVQVDRFRNLRP
jgi:hypothetical protein